MRKSNILIYCLLLIISIVPLASLLHQGLPVTHDGQDHVARIANFYQSLQDGVLIPRWAGNLNWGYGHPILMFLYPVPSYLASIFRLFGFSFVDSTKLVFGFLYILSIFTMYLYGSNRFGKAGGFAGAMLYGFAPYRFVDLYIRGAIGEHAAFVFMPIILFIIDKLAYANSLNTNNNLKIHKPKLKTPDGAKAEEDKQSYSEKVKVISMIKQKYYRYAYLNLIYGVLLSLSFAGLILSHNAISIMFLPIVIVYIWYVWKYENNKNPFYVLHTTFYILIGFGISGFFWIPALIEGRYTLRDIVTKGEFGNRFIDWKQLFYTTWNYGGDKDLPKDIGFAQWFLVISSILLFIKNRFEQKRLLFIFLAIFGISLFFMLPLSNIFWKYVTILQKFQFPWRFLTVSVLATSILGSFIISNLEKKWRIVSVIVIVCTILFTTHHMWKAKAYKIYDESFFTGIYDSTTDTGESSPIWSIRFMEKRANAPIEVIDGDATIEKNERTSVYHSYIIKAVRETRIVENTLYFPGWKVYIDGKQTNIQFQDPDYRGLMTFMISEGSHQVDIIFTETLIRKFANSISILSAGTVLLLCLYSFKQFKTKNIG